MANAPIAAFDNHIFIGIVTAYTMVSGGGNMKARYTSGNHIRLMAAKPVKLYITTINEAYIR